MPGARNEIKFPAPGGLGGGATPAGGGKTPVKSSGDRPSGLKTPKTPNSAKDAEKMQSIPKAKKKKTPQSKTPTPVEEEKKP